MDGHAAVAESHISILFLAGERVYKVHKAVDFGFLDFTDLARWRREDCHRDANRGEVYRTLAVRARRLLALGRTVVADATRASRGWRAVGAPAGARARVAPALGPLIETTIAKSDLGPWPRGPSGRHRRNMSSGITSAPITPSASSEPALPSQADLVAIVEELAAVSLRLDRAGQVAADGVITMSLDVASQAIHLALVELQDCLVDA